MIRLSNCCFQDSAVMQKSPPSGNGLHILGRYDLTKLPIYYEESRRRFVLDGDFYQKNSKIGLELYLGDVTNRYATFTGDAINDLPLADCTDAILTTLDICHRDRAAPAFVGGILYDTASV